MLHNYAPVENDHGRYARLNRHCHIYFGWNTIVQFSFAWSVQIYKCIHTRDFFSFSSFFSSVIHDVSPVSVYWDTDVYQCMMHNTLLLAIEEINRKSYIKRIILCVYIFDKLLTIVCKVSSYRFFSMIYEAGFFFAGHRSI